MIKVIKSFCKTHLPMWRVALLLVAAFAPVAAHAADDGWFERFFSFDTPLTRNVGASSNSFILKGIKLDASCLIREEQLQPLFQKMIGKPVSDAEILGLMRDMRSALAKQGFRSIQTSYPASDVKDGVVTINIKADVPAAMADVAMTQCTNQPVMIAGKTTTRKVVKTVNLTGMTRIDPQPFMTKANELQGKVFDAVAVINLMQQIRKAYRDIREPLPYITFDSELAKEGTINLKVVEKKRKGAPAADIPSSQVPVKVARPVPTPLVATSEKERNFAPADDRSNKPATPPQKAHDRLEIDGLRLIDTPEMRAAIKQQEKQAPAPVTKPATKPKPAPVLYIQSKINSMF